MNGIDAKTRRLRWSPLHACIIGTTHTTPTPHYTPNLSPLSPLHTHAHPHVPILSSPTTYTPPPPPVHPHPPTDPHHNQTRNLTLSPDLGWAEHRALLHLKEKASRGGVQGWNQPVVPLAKFHKERRGGGRH